MNRKIIITAAILLMLIPIIGNANYADTYGISASAISRGNAVTSSVSNWSSVYYNMAGLGRTAAVDASSSSHNSNDGMAIQARDTDSNNSNNQNHETTYPNELAISYLYSMPGVSIDIPLDGVTGDENLNFGMITLGFTLDLNNIYQMPSLISSARFGLCIGITQDFTLARVNDLDPMRHTLMRYGKKAQRTVILAGMGFGFLNDTFGIGIGANMLFGGKGYMSMRNVIATNPNQQMPEQDIQMDLQLRAAPAGGMFLDFGNIFSILEGLNFGFSYRGEIDLTIPIDADAKVDTLAITLLLFIEISEYYTPHIFTAGISYTLPVMPLTISFDIDYQLWSGFRFKQAQALYNENPEFLDIFVPKLGLHYQVFPFMAVSAGYTYRPSFVPDNALDGDINPIDGDTHIASAGMDFLIPQMGSMGGPVQFNIAYQFQYIPQRSVTKNPAKLTAGLEPFNPDYSFGGAVHSFTCEIILQW